MIEYVIYLSTTRKIGLTNVFNASTIVDTYLQFRANTLIVVDWLFTIVHSYNNNCILVLNFKLNLIYLIY